LKEAEDVMASFIGGLLLLAAVDPTRVAAAPPARQTRDHLIAMLLTQPIAANKQESDKKQKVA
jgi:hypothetical protein